ncbi:MAG: DUF2612 domain-containing protein [Deltaproteobacteria bacterium]|nr:DUF2612 domain-containing protein [Deltaproteobacteria bacterium]
MIPASYKVDFSQYRRDRAAEGLGRLLSQFVPSCVLRQFLAVILNQCQDLYDAVLDLMRKRTLHDGEGENLEALGRIVGEPRAPYSYDDSTWFFADTGGQGADQTAAWCLNAPFAAYVPAADPDYRRNILARIMKNHALTSSVPELARIGEAVTGYGASFVKTGPMRVALHVPSSISKTALALYTRAVTDSLADERYALPYPATLRVGDIVMFVPNSFFASDRGGDHGCDHAPCAVGSTHFTM